VVIRQAVHGACLAMGGVILLLLLGTQILDWRWLAALVAVGVAASARRPRIPSPYAVAQSVDRSLGYSDTLSTAWCYNRLDPKRKAMEEMRAAQMEKAERLSETAPLEQATPFRAPRSIYLMAALTLVASSFFALRYGLSHTLDLRPPLARMVFDAFHWLPNQPDPPETGKRAQDKRLREMLKQFGLSLDNKGAGESGDPQQARTPADEAAEKNEKRGERGKGPAQLQVSNERGEGRQARASSPGSQKTGEKDAATRADSQGDQAGDNAGRQTANSQTESNSLVNRFRDAMANLLSRLKSQPRGGAGQQMAQNGQGRQETGRSQQGGQKGAPMGRQSDGQPAGDPQGEEQGEGQQQAQSGSGKQAGRDAEQTSREGRSGIGRQDGSKDVREAEQLAAMGKISEIFGKRAQNLTGEVMVEVASGNQQLRTPYSQQSATHLDAGGEIHRDEIPLVYQRYVQQYFEEVRKAAAAPRPATKP
jgi:hypothetical protein